MTRVAIADAVCGGENVGDDAVLVSPVEQLRGIEPKVHIAVVSRDPNSMGKRFGISAVGFRAKSGWRATLRDRPVALALPCRRREVIGIASLGCLVGGSRVWLLILVALS